MELIAEHVQSVVVQPCQLTVQSHCVLTIGTACMVEVEVVACIDKVQVVQRSHTQHGHVHHLLLLSLVIDINNLVKHAASKLVYHHSHGDKGGEGEMVTLE
jgi:hypothetical protein